MLETSLRLEWNSSRLLIVRSRPDSPAELQFGRKGQWRVTPLHLTDRVLTLATRAFHQFPGVHGQVIPRVSYEADDKDAGMYAIDTQPKTVEGAVDCMQFYQNARRCRPQIPRHEVVKAVALRRTMHSVWRRENPLGSYRRLYRGDASRAVCYHPDDETEE